jgi:hypothetical protein
MTTPEDPFAAPPPGSPPPALPPQPGYGPPQGYGTPAPYGQQQPPPGYGQQQWGPPPGFAPGQSGTNGFAIASLICSLGTVFLGFTCILGVIFGHLARKQIRETGQGGAGLALAGLIIGYAFLALGGLFIVLIAVAFGFSGSNGTF